MKRLALFIYLTLCMLPLNAQNILSFSPSEHNFGVIHETEGKISHTFTGVNRSDNPIIVLDIVTSCGCTIPEFSKKPILKGEAFEVKVVYDPEHQFGTFSRNLSIFSVEREKIAILRIIGSVVPRERSVEDTYPLDVDDGLRLTSATATFSYVYRGRSTTSTIGYANASTKTISIKLYAEKSSGFLNTTYPHIIKPGERGEINFNYLIPDSSSCYGDVKDVFSLSINGTKSPIFIVIHGISVDNPALIKDNKAPKMELLKNFVNFAAVKRNSSTQSQFFTISNSGNETLNIRAVETMNGITVSLKSGDKIATGDSRNVEIKINPANYDYGVMSSYFTIITDDPARPMRKIRVTAIIED